MQLKPILLALALASATAPALAGGIESFVGKSPSRLLKQEPHFAKAYRAAIKNQDLPDWTKRLAVGFPTEHVVIDGKDTFLMSACNPQSGCGEERFYLLYVPDEQSVIGFFFLPPNDAAPGDHRMALSRWIGKELPPPKTRSDFLMQRAMQDAQEKQNAPKDGHDPASAKDGK